LISNLLEEEVFVEVTGLDSLGYHLESKHGGFALGGGTFVLFPTNTALLKRLHAASYQDGKAMLCGCCFARIESSIGKDVLDIGHARGTVDVWIRGYYRKTGKHFSESIKLPIEIVEKLKKKE